MPDALKLNVSRAGKVYIKPVVVPTWNSVKESSFVGFGNKEQYEMLDVWYCKEVDVFFLFWVFNVKLCSLKGMCKQKNVFELVKPVHS